MAEKNSKRKFEELSVKQQKYLTGLIMGKPKRKAALQAGYSENYSNQACRIETEDVKAAFQELVRKKIPASKIIKRIAQGMDAVETKFFTHNGQVTDARDCILWNERRQSAELAAQIGGYWQPRQEIEHTQKIDERTLSRFADIAERLNIKEIGLEDRRKLIASHVPLIEADDDHNT